jgi:hypothetical protein
VDSWAPYALPVRSWVLYNLLVWSWVHYNLLEYSWDWYSLPVDLGDWYHLLFDRELAWSQYHLFWGQHTSFWLTRIMSSCIGSSWDVVATKADHICTRSYYKHVLYKLSTHTPYTSLPLEKLLRCMTIKLTLRLLSLQFFSTLSMSRGRYLRRCQGADSPSVECRAKGWSEQWQKVSQQVTLTNCQAQSEGLI